MPRYAGRCRGSVTTDDASPRHPRYVSPRVLVRGSRHCVEAARTCRRTSTRHTAERRGGRRPASNTPFSAGRRTPTRRGAGLWADAHRGTGQDEGSPVEDIEEAHMGFEPGHRKVSGRRAGVPNKTSGEGRAMSRRLLDDPAYWKSPKRRLIRGEAPRLEQLIWEYGYGWPQAERDDAPRRSTHGSRSTARTTRGPASAAPRPGPSTRRTARTIRCRPCP